jgi:hypothetical protein
MPTELPLEAAILRSKAKFPYFWTVLSLVIVIGAVVIGGIALMTDVATWLPRLSMQPSELRDPQNPASAAMTIKNESTYSIYSVEYECIQNEAVSAKGGRYRSNVVSQTGSDIAEIVAGGSKTIYCAKIFYQNMKESVPIVTTDFMVRLSFYPGFLGKLVGYRSEKIFRLVADTSEGKFVVDPQPQIPIPDVGPQQK